MKAADILPKYFYVSNEELYGVIKKKIILLMLTALSQVSLY
jgi:hypothetical protein